jgi:hypothetical protein
MTGFWGFRLSMVLLTFGELIFVPTASNMLPTHFADLRGNTCCLLARWGLACTFSLSSADPKR